MADVAHSSRSQVRVYRSAKGAPRILNFQESTASATAVIGVGQVVSLDIDASSANFRIVRCSTGSGQSPILSTSIVGVSAQASTSDGSTTGLSNPLNRQISVWAADADTEFLFPTKVVIASTLINTNLELSWDSTLSFHHVSANSTAGDAAVLITGIPNTAVIGDTGGYLIGRFQSTRVSPLVQSR